MLDKIKELSKGIGTKEEYIRIVKIILDQVSNSSIEEVLILKKILKLIRRGNE